MAREKCDPLFPGTDFTIFYRKILFSIFPPVFLYPLYIYMIKLNVMIESVVVHLSLTFEYLRKQHFTVYYYAAFFHLQFCTFIKSSSATTSQGTLSNKCKFKLKNSRFDDRFSLLCLQLQHAEYYFLCTNRVEFLPYHFIFLIQHISSYYELRNPNK